MLLLYLIFSSHKNTLIIISLTISVFPLPTFMPPVVSHKYSLSWEISPVYTIQLCNRLHIINLFIPYKMQQNTSIFELYNMLHTTFLFITYNLLHNNFLLITYIIIQTTFVLLIYNILHTIWLSITACLHVCLSVCLSECLPVWCLSACLSLWLLAYGVVSRFPYVTPPWDNF